MRNTYLHELGNPLVAFFKGLALELEDARDSMRGALNAMTIFGADGKYLDLWGDYMNVTRQGGEGDNDYAHRIMFFLKQTRVNNKSIEILIKEILGYETEVIDIGWQTPDSLIYMNNVATPINHNDYAIWNDSSYVSADATFYVKMLSPAYSSLTETQKTELLTFVNSVKQIGTKAVLEL